MTSTPHTNPALRGTPRKSAEIIRFTPPPRSIASSFERPAAPQWFYGDRVIGHIRGREFRGHVQFISRGTAEPRIGVRVFDGPEQGVLKIIDSRDLVAHLGSFIQ
ncbi:hypothetical protein [Hyphobacterium sp.]|uniref:hypothetical protein n=1 Tax=Hyphobacterium sp. TaxID=2004662 RepID=UPI003BAA666C